MKKKTTVSPFPSFEELRGKRAAEGVTPARAALSSLFDDRTFVELGTYTKRSYHDGALIGKDDEFAGVITGYGAVNGQLIFAFAQDETRMKGAIDAAHADKIVALYDLALKKGAPVVGMFASAGADLYEGVTAMAAYGRIVKAVSDASDEIPSIAFVRGACLGTAAAVASSFDFVVIEKSAPFYVSDPALGGIAADIGSRCFCGTESEALGYIRALLDFLPDGSIEAETADDLNRLLPPLALSEDVHATLIAVADDGKFLETYQEYGTSIVTAFASIGGIKCGIVASNPAVEQGKITRDSAYKTAEFLTTCDAFGIPVVTLVNAGGVATDTSVDALRSLALSYAQLGVPAITVILERAIGAAFTLMGSKSLGAELVYALPSAEIGILNAASSVAFACNDEISADVTREELEAKWRLMQSSAVTAASAGAVDDLIEPAELRTHIASALLMLTC